MIKIRIHKKIDIPYRVKWLNSPNVNKYIGDELGRRTTLKKQEKWFKDYQKDKNKKFFTILFNNKPIGLVGLSNISKQNKNADLFIMIGEDSYRGRGIGKEAMKFIIGYAFNNLKLHKINLGVIEDNKVAVNLYKKLGFKIEGKMIDEIYSKGKFYNFLSMALFKKDYTA
ncbi:MAG: GNAT family N-acetyltransferase [Candidatus Pacebacteria bacterium]|nr:GNAT family N-acetyltransferase [Candidatus Paceibacterota bacterium]